MSSETLDTSTPETQPILGELVLRDGRPFFKDEDGMMHELNPKDEDEGFSAADYLPLAPSASGLEPADYELTLRISGKGHPQNIMQLASQSPQFAAQNQYPGTIVSSRVDRYIDEDTRPYDYDEQVGPRYEDETTQPLPEQRATVAPRVKRSSNVEAGPVKRKSNKFVVVGAAVVGSLIFGGLVLNADEVGKNAGDICAAKGLAGMWSDPGCIVRHLATDALHLPIPEDK